MVAILFARQDSHYKTIPGLDVYDIDRDARTFLGGVSVVAHPPCRAWGRLRQFAKPRDGEKDLGRFAVAMVRKFGGVLEHPSCSTLWEDQKLPKPGAFPDEFGGIAVEVEQWWWGHRAEKRTWLYIVGAGSLPPIPTPPRGSRPTHCIRPTKAYPRLPSVTKREREATPPAFAAWLVEVAKNCRPTKETA